MKYAPVARLTPISKPSMFKQNLQSSKEYRSNKNVEPAKWELSQGLFMLLVSHTLMGGGGGYQ